MSREEYKFWPPLQIERSMDGGDFNKAAKNRAQPCVSDYMDMLDDDLSEEQKLELLETLFNIMKSFVMIGYGMEAVDKLVHIFQKCNEDDLHLLELGHKTHKY